MSEVPRYAFISDSYEREAHDFWCQTSLTSTQSATILSSWKCLKALQSFLKMDVRYPYSWENNYENNNYHE
jgi:hypothetical protein